MFCYKLNRLPSIVVACCIFHNWIYLSTRNDWLFREYEVEDFLVQGQEKSIGSTSHSIDLSNESTTSLTTCRDQIAQVIWSNHININPWLILFLILNIFFIRQLYVRIYY